MGRDNKWPRQKFHSLAHFLNRYQLTCNSTKELIEYSQFVKMYVELRGNTKCKSNRGLERHHIIPRQFFGSNVPRNYVFLTHDEHMYAHHLFYRAIMSSSQFTEKDRNKAKVQNYSIRQVVRGRLLRKRPLMLCYHAEESFQSEVKLI